MRASTADILIINNIVYKTIGNNKYQYYHVYERDVFWLNRFRDVDCVPNLIGNNDRINSISMEFVGYKLNKLNIPNDFENQLININIMLKKHNCQHNDINIDNILVDNNNKIFLIDFGWTTFINDTIENVDDKYYQIVSHQNLNNFPRELNQFYLNNGKLDDDYAFDIIKHKLNEIRCNI